LVECGIKAGRRAVNVSGVCRETGFDPGAKSAVEKVDILGSGGLEHPPCSRAGENAFLLVDDDVHLITDTKSRKAPGKDLVWRQHVGQRAGAVRELLNIKEDCVWNMAREVVRSGIHCWRDTDWRKRGIKDNDTWTVQTAS
jgi:hypothetical protein